jgi:hypothetical protein
MGDFAEDMAKFEKEHKPRIDEMSANERSKFSIDRLFVNERLQMPLNRMIKLMLKQNLESRNSQEKIIIEHILKGIKKLHDFTVSKDFKEVKEFMSDKLGDIVIDFFLLELFSFNNK